MWSETMLARVVRYALVVQAAGISAFVIFFLVWVIGGLLGLWDAFGG